MTNLVNVARAMSLLVVVSFNSCSKEYVAEPPVKACTVDYSLQAHHEFYFNLLKTYGSNTPAPGSIMGVKRVGEPEWIGAIGYSNLEHKTLMTACTPFRSGSITKVFTAVVIMQLIEQGKLNLNTSVSEVLPELNGQIPSIEKITIKQLLNHSSGLGHPNDDDLSYRLAIINGPKAMGEKNYKQRLASYVYNKPLKHEPGVESYYSNAGYWVLGMVIEKLVNKPVAQVIEDAIVKPLGLSHTYLSKQSDIDVARGYNFSGNRMKDVTVWDRADSDGDPAAGVVTTASDLLLFGEALFTTKLIGEPALQLMQETTNFPSCGGDCGFGLGIETWHTQSNTGFGKNGSSLGVDANLIFFPKHKKVVVLFSNFGGGNRKEIMDQLL
jgi:D-alanyl-D-alanine carboxypeptidase